MQKTWDTVISMYEKYMGDSLHMVLLTVAVIYLLVTFRKKKEHLVFVIISLLFGAICFSPVTAKIIMKYCIGRSVYWRMFWILPGVCITAYAGVSWLVSIKKKALRPVLLVLLAAVIGVTGTCIDFNQQYTAADNVYKLPSPTVEICEAIAADSEIQGIEQVKVLVPNQLVCYIRQYDASFLTPYGRNVFRYENLTQNQAGLFSQMSSDEADAATLNMLLRNEGCNYFVWDRLGQTREDFEQYDFVPVCDVDDYRVFRIE